MPENGCDPPESARNRRESGPTVPSEAPLPTPPIGLLNVQHVTRRIRRHRRPQARGKGHAARWRLHPGAVSHGKRGTGHVMLASAQVMSV